MRAHISRLSLAGLLVLLASSLTACGTWSPAGVRMYWLQEIDGPALQMTRITSGFARPNTTTLSLPDTVGTKSRVAGLDLSPNGEFLVLTVENEGQTGFWRHHLSTNENTFMFSLAGRVSGIGLSPSGNELAVVVTPPRILQGKGKLVLYDCHSGTIRDLCEGSDFGSAPPAWSSDGNYIIVTSRRTESLGDRKPPIWALSTTQDFQGNYAMDRYTVEIRNARDGSLYRSVPGCQILPINPDTYVLLSEDWTLYQLNKDFEISRAIGRYRGFQGTRIPVTEIRCVHGSERYIVGVRNAFRAIFFLGPHAYHSKVYLIDIQKGRFSKVFECDELWDFVVAKE